MPCANKRATAMPMLYAKCRVTGSLIETGVSSDDDSLVIMAHSRMAVFCETCGQHHMLRVRELHCAAVEEDAAA